VLIIDNVSLSTNEFNYFFLFFRFGKKLSDFIKPNKGAQPIPFMGKGISWLGEEGCDKFN
jgi:hypothetical protein